MKKSSPSISVRRSLEKLGQDIRLARLRRDLTMQLVSERSKISLSTLDKIEKGNPDVSMGNYASVLFALNLGTPLAEVIDPSKDSVGLLLDLDKLPKRAGRKKVVK